VREFDCGDSEDRYAELERAAAKHRPGGSGLVVLDWWNGNRSILADADLSGLVAGLTLQTRPDQIYRAMLESIAFGNRRIIDNFEEHGLGLGEIVACGGIAEKSPLLMQMIADVARRPVRVPASSQVPARGAALFGAVAAGRKAGGFEDIGTAIAATAPAAARSFLPDRATGEAYERIYRVYRQLYDAFGATHAGLLHELKRIASEA
jgi:L-ribulokinase